MATASGLAANEAGAAEVKRENASSAAHTTGGTPCPDGPLNE
jgi:hypothetical protein